MNGRRKGLPRNVLGALALNMAATLVLAAIGVGWQTARADPPDGPPPGMKMEHEGFGFAIGHHGGPMMGEGPGPMLPLILHHVSLTSEQHEQVRKILDADRQTLGKLFKQLEQANQKLSDRLFASGDVKLADLGAQISEITDLRRELMEQGVKTTIAIRSVLTPAQLAKVTTLKQRIDKLHGEMRQLMEEKD